MLVFLNRVYAIDCGPLLIAHSLNKILIFLFPIVWFGGTGCLTHLVNSYNGGISAHILRFSLPNSCSISYCFGSSSNCIYSSLLHSSCSSLTSNTRYNTNRALLHRGIERIHLNVFHWLK
ncbi:hypothetical protein [Crucivirus-432]|nr:hypothetical protein [Crucivirus-432]